MDLVTVIGIAVGLSMDAFAVSIASGCSEKNEKFGRILRMALFFGGFQFLMPLVGWLSGLEIRNLLSSVDYLIAFGLLFLVGAKMIYESTRMKENKSCPTDLGPLFLLSIATSIDALAVGLSLSFLNSLIILPALIIGIVTFFFSLAGFFIGKRFGHLFEKRIEIIGGLILIILGFKILLEHFL